MKISKHGSSYLGFKNTSSNFLVNGFIVILSDSLVPIMWYQTGDIISSSLFLDLGIMDISIIALEDSELLFIRLSDVSLLDTYIQYLGRISTMSSILFIKGIAPMHAYILHSYLMYLGKSSREFKIVLYQYEKLVSSYTDCRHTLLRYLRKLQSKGFLTYNRGTVRLLKDLEDYLF